MKLFLPTILASTFLISSCKKEKTIFCNPITGHFTQQLEIFPDLKETYNYTHRDQVTKFTKSKNIVSSFPVTCYKDYNAKYESKDIEIFCSASYNQFLDLLDDVEHAHTSNWFQTKDMQQISVLQLLIEPNGDFNIFGDPQKIYPPRNKELIKESVTINEMEYENVFEADLGSGIINKIWIQIGNGMIAFRDSEGIIWVRD